MPKDQRRLLLLWEINHDSQTTPNLREPKPFLEDRDEWPISSNQETKLGTMEKTDQKKFNIKDEHHRHLSSAYIRSLVKQLTTSRTMNPRNPDGDLTKFGQVLGDDTQKPQKPQQQHKKQVRRRLHTSRPYQERLLNMAEARKEIVTALKYHRAAMKQAREKQQPEPHQDQSPPSPQPPPPPLQSNPRPCFEPEAKIKSRRNQRIYPSNSGSFSHHPYSPPSPPPPNFLPWQAPQIAPPPVLENLNFNLPYQPLGLNLNFHDFTNLDANLYHHSNNNFNPSSSSIYSSDCSSSLSSSSPPLPVATKDTPSDHPVASDLTDLSGGLHPAMDDKEMAEIRSIGDKHEMEWKDTMSLVTSAWWFKFLKTEQEEEINGEYSPFDEVMQFPSWLNPSESFGLQQQQHYYSEDYSQIPALPRMDIGDFEGMDGEWLSYKD